MPASGKHSLRKNSTLKKMKSKSIDLEYSVNDLPSLRRKRTLALNRIEKAFEIGKLAKSDDNQRDLFLSYCDKVDKFQNEFEQAHMAILELISTSEDDGDEQELDDEDLRTRFDDTYFQVISIRKTLTKSDLTTSNASSYQTKSAVTSHIKLPKISLPSFSGNIKQFPEYLDAFKALIHDCSSLTDVEKFHYLISSLSGDPLSHIRTFPVTGDHYQDAFTALVSRYQHTRELTFTCWKDILNVSLKLQDAVEFRRALDSIEENLKILRKQALPVDKWDFILVYHILSKLDSKLRREFEEKYSNAQIPSYINLKEFLNSKCEALMRDTHFLDTPKPNKTFHQQSIMKRTNVSHTLVVANNARPTIADVSEKRASVPIRCSYCNDSHSISSCSEFLKKSIDERMKIAEDKKWCFNCLKSSHQLKNCNSIFTCRSCKRKHHSLLHRDKSNAHAPHSDVTSTLVSKSQTKSAVLLPTAIVQVKDAHGNMQSFRSIFDSGSQNNFITESAVKRLQLVPCQTSVSVSGLGDAVAPITGDVTCSVGTNNQVLFNLNMQVIPTICTDQPIANLNSSRWSHIKSLRLADPNFNIPGPVDILFAADVFADSLLGQQIKGSQNQPTAFNSIFGWLLLGKTTFNSSATLLASNLPFHADAELNSLVQRFWELDNVPKATLLTPEEQVCEQKFIAEHYRDPSGRYVVKYPFKEDIIPIFEGSREVALRRFHATEKRLIRNPELHSQYHEFMSDYLESGHMSLVPSDQVGLGKFYLPHHYVLRPDSRTTRLRVVFDASAKDLNARSLNDSQFIGPKLQPDIFKILLHFRLHQIALMADVQQMFRQIFVSPDHRDFQRIFWRWSVSDLLEEYYLNTVSFGVSSSPYLACRTLRQLAEDDGDKYPLAKQIILSNVYVDDVVCGFNNRDVANEAKTQLIELFNLGGFKLRKWISNEPQLLGDLPIEDRLQGSISLDKTEPSPLQVLGLKWDPSTDCFLFSVKPSEQPCTKRSILSELARIFDPLGFLSPITIQAKCLIQKLWIIGVNWDETPPIEVVQAWTSYSDQLPQLKELRIPRNITNPNAKLYELHGFCDSSESAYGAVIYLRSIDKNGDIQVNFVCSKARVVPLKRISLPRLELCSAVLLADLYKYVCDTYLEHLQVHSVFLWSDATIVLYWLRSHSSRWATFVANRVSHIQEITPSECWHHVSSGDNPADICSRGLYPGDILNNSLWWAGPDWLSRERESWPSQKIYISQENENIAQTEARKPVALVTAQVSDNTDSNLLTDLTHRFSSLPKLLNVLSYINRFINAVRTYNRINKKQNLIVDNVERHNALMQIVKHVQSIAFSDEIASLKIGKPVLKQFRKLNPFNDDRGVLRVGGRLSRSGLEYEHKHPAILPSDHPLTYLIIEHIHRSYCHTGVNTTHFLLLQQFWVVSAKRTIRRVLSKCVECYRLHPQPLQPFMSDLPAYRVNQVKAFSEVGVDLGGPFRIKLGLHRGAKIDKAYLCLFVCLATKAVHLEVVSTLSSDGFIAALRRFVARRGRCNVIHSDCGTNFVGARNQLASLMENASHAEKIEFKFNPPSAPHFGGVWEIQIKAAKTHLYRVVGDQVLTFEELTTLFAQIEAVLNSRPLCPVGTDPNDLSVLTPGHFLTLEPLTAVPDEDLSSININRLHRWQLLQAFQQNFWSRWKHEYLNSLTQRAKWTKDSKPLSVGSMVIIKDDNRAPLHWTLGRVQKLISGADGVVRIAMVKTATNNIVQRPLVKLCPLPTDDSHPVDPV